MYEIFKKMYLGMIFYFFRRYDFFSEKKNE